MVITAMTPEGVVAVPRDAPRPLTTTTATRGDVDDDEDWWSDAEEIDLTAAFPKSQFIFPPSGESAGDGGDEGDPYPEGGIDEEIEDYLQDFFTSNESCFWDIECDDFGKMIPPPEFEGAIPPPPLPPFMRGLEEYIKESPPRLGEVEAGGMTVVELIEDSVAEARNCILCEWAKAGNDSLNFWTLRKGNLIFFLI